MVIAYISLGTNLYKKYKNIKNAIAYIAKSCKILDISSIYLTSPLENTKQPYFYNCVVKIDTNLTPFSLLKLAKDIEKLMGRTYEKERYQPRIIDIDILFYGRKIINTKNLKIPHPKIQNRKFVIYPMEEIAKNFIHPTLHKKVFTLRLQLRKDISQYIKLVIPRKNILNYFKKLKLKLN